MSNSPYSSLRKEVRVDVHNQAQAPSVQTKWIKPASASVNVPEHILTALEADIEKRHAGKPKAEEIVWNQAPRPLKESIRYSWASGSSIAAVVVAVFASAAIAVAAPKYLFGTIVLPPLAAIAICYLLSARVRCDLKGHYVVTKHRAIIVVPKRHLFGLFPPLIVSFEYTLERSLIVHKLEMAGIHERILKREPKLVDFYHTKHSTGAVTFYPRTKLQIPFHFRNVQHSHSFEMVFCETVVNSPAPTNGGSVRVDRPSFEEQKRAAKKFKIYPILGGLWIALLILSVTGPAWGIYSKFQAGNSADIALTAVAWISVQFAVFAIFYPIYISGRAKQEGRANGRYMKFMVEAR